MTSQDIKDLETTTELELEIKEIIVNNVEAYNNPVDFFTDVANSGCKSGMINELHCYNQTSNFVKRHAEDINDAISEILDMLGIDSIEELLGDKFDDTDHLCIGQVNRNLIAWFIFEASCESILNNFNDLDVV